MALTNGALIKVNGSVVDSIQYTSDAVADVDYQSVLAEGAFADGDKTKLNGIEAGADVTDTANVTAAGALMDSELTSLSGVKTLTVPDSTTISAFGATLVDDADAATARGTLGAASDTVTFEALVSDSVDTVDIDITAEAGKLTLTADTIISVPAITSLASGEVRFYFLRVIGASTYTLAFDAGFLAGTPTPDVTMTAGAPSDYGIIMDKDANTVTVVSIQTGAA